MGKIPIGALITLASLAATVLGDVATPSPTRANVVAEHTAGSNWGSIVGIALFAFAAVMILLWLTRKLMKKN